MSPTRTTMGGARSVTTFPPRSDVPSTVTMRSCYGSGGLDTTRVMYLPPHQTGDIIIITLEHYDNGTPTLSGATGWTAGTATAADGNTRKMWWWWKRATSNAETNPSTGNGNLQGQSYTVTVWSGCITTGSPIAAVNSNAMAGTTNTTITGASVTTTQPSQTVLHFFRVTASGTYSTTSTTLPRIISVQGQAVGEYTSLYTEVVPVSGTAVPARSVTSSAAGSGGGLDIALIGADPMPLSITGLLVWLKADSYALANNTTLSTDWADQSGNANNGVVGPRTSKFLTGRTATGGPSISTGVVSSYSGGFVLSSSTFTGTTAAEAFIVLKANADPNTGGNNGGSMWRMGGNDLTFYTYGVDGQIYDGAFTSTRFNVDPTPNVSSAFHCYNVSCGGGTWTSRLDNAQIDTHAQAYSAPAAFTLGTDAGNGWNGEMAEFLVYNSVLSTTDRGRVWNYLRARHGL